MASSHLLADLDLRGLIHTSTKRGELERRLAEGPLRLYCGFDPTADSLHIGNLVPLLMLRRFQDAGHPPIALAGGATGMIGDPTGRSEERVLLDEDTLGSNLEAIKGQLEMFLDFAPGPSRATVVDNRSWTEPISFLDFLRDVGRHMTVNTMISRESVRNRLDSEHGISFTEFSYMLLQANDFDHLHGTLDCGLQVGGSDQWGNICSGIDLIRRRRGHVVHGLTVPLITRSDGSKFGKSSGGNVWLDAGRTSPYRFYQYWLGIDDRDVERFLLQLTLLDVETSREVAEQHEADPALRIGQRRLAEEMTALVHGRDVVEPIEAASAVLFGEALGSVTEATFEMLASEIPFSRRSLGEVDGGADLRALFVDTNLASSKGEVRKNASGYYVNNERLADQTSAGRDRLLHGRFLLLRKGKTNHHLVEFA